MDLEYDIKVRAMQKLASLVKTAEEDGELKGQQHPGGRDSWMRGDSEGPEAGQPATALRQLEGLELTGGNSAQQMGQLGQAPNQLIDNMLGAAGGMAPGVGNALTQGVDQSNLEKNDELYNRGAENLPEAMLNRQSGDAGRFGANLEDQGERHDERTRMEELQKFAPGSPALNMQSSLPVPGKVKF